MLVYEFFQSDVNADILTMLTTNQELAETYAEEYGIPYKVWLAEIVVEPAADATENVKLGYSYCNGDVHGWVKLVSEII